MKLSCRSFLSWISLSSTTTRSSVVAFSHLPRRTVTLLSRSRTTQRYPSSLIALPQRLASSSSSDQEQTRTTIMTSTSTTDNNDKTTTVHTLPFDESLILLDHYNGVTLRLVDNNSTTNIQPDSFRQDLTTALQLWKAEGKKGIWIHLSTDYAFCVPIAIELGFAFHFVKDQSILVLSQWLFPSPSRLPLGPTHQVGVGIVLFHPTDPSQMLVVQEKTGPAAAIGLWKMPTGLLDPNEDIPVAAQRELLEETGINHVSFSGILCFKQSHSETRMSSDMFFVCRMQLLEQERGKGDDNSVVQWKPQEEEIAAIRWMSVDDYCNQERWKESPVYETLNDCIRHASQQQSDKMKTPALITHDQLDLGYVEGTNAFFRVSR